MKTELHLSVDDLHTYFYAREHHAFFRAVDGVSLNLHRGETLGIVGESGSGKSVTMLSVLGLIGGEPGVIRGRAQLYHGNEPYDLFPDMDGVVQVDAENGQIRSVTKNMRRWDKSIADRLAAVRGKRISIIFQNPKAAMNPFDTIGTQIVEAIRLHTNIKSRAEAKEKAYYWLERVRIDSPKLRFHSYPYGLSGGMCQRAMVAMALASEPALLIADEPTTGLDATIQARVVELLEELKQDLGISVILISHDIHVIARLSDAIAVMYAGQVLENGPSSRVLDRSNQQRHPYTKALLDSVPSRDFITETGHIPSIKGELPNLIGPQQGCRFYSRCQAYTPDIENRCANEIPPMVDVGANHKVRCWKVVPV